MMIMMMMIVDDDCVDEDEDGHVRYKRNYCTYCTVL